MKLIPSSIRALSLFAVLSLPLRADSDSITKKDFGTADGQPLRVWFTDLAVKLAGSDVWVEAQ